MLADKHIDELSKLFGVYDHDWRFYSEFLGEPFLIGNVVVYFDGEIIFICAFPLGDVWKELTSADVSEITNSRDDFRRAKGINLWGRFSFAPEVVKVGDNVLSPIRVDNYPDSFDVAVKIPEFDYSINTKARLARNSVQNKGLTMQVLRRSYFTVRHIELISKWLDGHHVSLLHLAIATTVSSFIKQENVYSVEVYDVSGSLVGFAILSLPSPKKAVMTQCFLDNTPGYRSGDGVMVAIIEFARQRGIDQVHFGYSSTASLLRFKRKWGAAWDGPTYREVFYSRSSELSGLFNSGQFLWRDRLLVRQASGK